MTRPDPLLEPLVRTFADGIRKRPVPMQRLTEWELLCRRKRREEAVKAAAVAKARKKKPARPRRAVQIAIDFEIESRGLGDWMDPPVTTTVPSVEEPFVATDSDVPF